MKNKFLTAEDKITAVVAKDQKALIEDVKDGNITALLGLITQNQLIISLKVDKIEKQLKGKNG